MIIGISGKIGSGKDTLANIIIKHYPSFQTKSFAYKLKQIVAILTGTTIHENIDRDGKLRYMDEWNMTLGVMQQKIGTECFRDNFNSETWVIGLLCEYKNGKNGKNEKNNWIITDTRFTNEANSIRRYDKNSILIRIEGDPADVRKNSKRDKNHPSEISLDDYDDFDYRIKNDGSLIDLENKILEILHLNLNLPNKSLSKEE